MPAPAALPRQRPLIGGALTILAGLAVCALLGALPFTASAQAIAPAPAASAAVPAASTVAQPASTAGAASTTVRRASATRAPASGKQAVRHTTGPLWTELTEPQRLALAPLAPKWDTVSEAQKRKWIALSRNFPRMSG